MQEAVAFFWPSVRNCLSYVRKHCANAMAAGSAAALWADFRKTYQKILNCKDYVTNYLAAVVLNHDLIESVALIAL